MYDQFTTDELKAMGFVAKVIATTTYPNVKSVSFTNFFRTVNEADEFAFLCTLNQFKSKIVLFSQIQIQKG